MKHFERPMEFWKAGVLGFVAASALIFWAGCSSLPKSLNRVQEGMDKDSVLEIVGSPKRTYRSNGEDRWLYEYYQDGQKVARQVSFESGKVIKVSGPLNESQWPKELESAETMEEYEYRVRSHETKTEGFRSLSGETEPKSDEKK